MDTQLKVFMKSLKSLNVILVFNPANLEHFTFNSRINLSFKMFKSNCGSQAGVLSFSHI